MSEETQEYVDASKVIFAKGYRLWAKSAMGKYPNLISIVLLLDDGCEVWTVLPIPDALEFANSIRIKATELEAGKE